jgi:cellobiose epimerase
MVFIVVTQCMTPVRKSEDIRSRILAEIRYSMKAELLDAWYPRALDKEYGGFLSAFTYDFKPTGDQDKMIVTQARHVWTNAKASLMYPDEPVYSECAAHGFSFLRDVMWDHRHGGFHTLVSRQGIVKSGAGEEKTAYGNAFGIYALAAYYAASKDTSALTLAQEAFHWLEKNSHDPVHKGYFQHMNRTGEVIIRDNKVKSTAETGYKDQNSSIHLLEAFAELYQVWPDPLLAERLQEMLTLIRDTIVQPEGYMMLFFTPDWKPVSYRDSSEQAIRQHYNLDHVSFGHDVETAYLMIEASHVLGNRDDRKTMAIAKKMVDHSLDNGWDEQAGGFYDAGYYNRDEPGLKIIKDTKNWWAQAEGLNSLLLMSDHFPDDEQQYFERFVKLWNYTNANLIDHEYGEWYQGGLDKEPELKTGLKGHIWKASYHQFRALMNCAERLSKGGAGH